MPFESPSANVFATASALSAVAIVSYFVGRWDAERERNATTEQHAPAAQEHGGDSQKKCVKAELREKEAFTSVEELLRLLAQFPAKKLGQQDQQAPHSTAKVVLVCASGKGGVGKSTVSVNLAFMLKMLGLEVGLLDLDVYGPSLPQLVKLPSNSVMQNAAGRIVPLDYGGVGLMSWGYMQPGEAATIRAPILNQIVTQLLTGIEWGALDILVIDSPPGTGDVLLSLAQSYPIDGAVLITTCNQISVEDVVKGIQLFEKVSIPPIAVVANMASFSCEACGHQHELFSDGAMSKLPEYLGDQGIQLVKLPLDTRLSQAPRQALPPLTYDYPFVRNPSNEDSAAWKGFHTLAKGVLEALLNAKGRDGSSSTSVLKLRPGGSLELRLSGGDLIPVACSELRASCRCAHCIDDLTGEVKIDRERIRRDRSLFAKDLETVGNYAVRVSWSDGHSSVIALRAVERLATRTTETSKTNGAKDPGW